MIKQDVLYILVHLITAHYLWKKTSVTSKSFKLNTFLTNRKTFLWFWPFWLYFIKQESARRAIQRNSLISFWITLLWLRYYYWIERREEVEKTVDRDLKPADVRGLIHMKNKWKALFLDKLFFPSKKLNVQNKWTCMGEKDSMYVLKFPRNVMYTRDWQ